MLSGSKSDYKIKYPNHVVFFNACIFDSCPAPANSHIWYGDIDLTLDSEHLQKIADMTGKTFYVTQETPCRWNGLKEEDLNNPYVKIFK
jgi:hypothetical protein